MKKEKTKGTKFYSKYLASDCTVVWYINDKHWWFRAHAHGDRLMKAETRLSRFTGNK